MCSRAQAALKFRLPWVVRKPWGKKKRPCRCSLASHAPNFSSVLRAHRSGKLSSWKLSRKYA